MGRRRQFPSLRLPARSHQFDRAFESSGPSPGTWHARRDIEVTLPPTPSIRLTRNAVLARKVDKSALAPLRRTA
jgi:hypothetical protein